MKKILLGLSSVLLIVNSVMGMDEPKSTKEPVKRTQSAPLLNTGSVRLLEGVTQKPRANSLPTVILPTMNAGRLTIKELRAPRWLSERDEYVDSKEIKNILLEISKCFRERKFDDVYNAVSRLTSDLLVDSQNRPEKWEDICNICEIVYVMLLESGYINWNVFRSFSVRWVEDSALRKHLLIDDSVVTESVLKATGLYSSALRSKLLPQYHVNSIPSKPLSDFMSRNKDWPTQNFLSWIILQAQQGL